MKTRALVDQERLLISTLLSRSAEGISLIASLDQQLVCQMDDGGMGSLTFFNPDEPKPKFGKTLIRGEFVDEDGTPVSVTLDLDTEHRLYELDIWKVDFSPLKRWPQRDEVRIIPPTSKT